ncbi:MAG: hypothetical protein Q3966_04990 [Neisseria sp.]|nr:hypothetical protein [Neisseria sp.]
MNRKMLLLKAVAAIVLTVLVFVFYRKEGDDGLHYFLIVFAVHFAADCLERYGNRKALAAFYADKEAAYAWLAQNLTGSRVEDLKLVRRHFKLPLAAAVEVLDEYRRAGGRSDMAA